MLTKHLEFINEIADVAFKIDRSHSAVAMEPHGCEVVSRARPFWVKGLASETRCKASSAYIFELIMLNLG